ncbi:MAG: hypothetical protein LBR88_10945 [Zoogloeaceae bacterium]|nr:hypothetical protein [Zoogloeaceae bacterium]
MADLVPAEENKRSDAVAAVDEMLAFIFAANPQTRWQHRSQGAHRRGASVSFVLDASVALLWLAPNTRKR